MAAPLSYFSIAALLEGGFDFRSGGSLYVLFVTTLNSFFHALADITRTWLDHDPQPRRKAFLSYFKHF